MEELRAEVHGVLLIFFSVKLRALTARRQLSVLRGYKIIFQSHPALLQYHLHPKG